MKMTLQHRLDRLLEASLAAAKQHCSRANFGLHGPCATCKLWSVLIEDPMIAQLSSGDVEIRRPNCMCGTGFDCELPEHIAAKAPGLTATRKDSPG